MTKLVDEVLNVSLFEAVPMAVDPDVSALVRATGERIEAARDAFLAHDLHDFMVRRGEARASQPVARAGFLRQADERLRLSGDSIVSRNTLVSFSVESLADKYVLLRVDGRTYRFPAVAEEAFRVVRTLMCQRVSALKLGLDYEATLMLVGHLVDNGVLVIH